jgi:hypothetical protein
MPLGRFGASGQLAITVAVKPAPQGAIRTTRVGAENASAKRVKCTPALARENQGEPVTGFYGRVFNSSYGLTFNAWECPCYNSGNYNNFVPDITIDRKVFQDTDGKWKYQIQKSGYTNTVILP